MNEGSDDFLEDWEKELEGVKPLKGKEKASGNNAPKTIIIVPKEEAGISRKMPQKVVGSSDGLDAMTARRLKSGEYPIEGKLDLHGCFQEQAYQRLVDFVRASYQQKKRCLLVVTGKGKGVLKGALPNWLNAEPIAPYILAVYPASKRHGGEGAFYILLRKSM